MTADSNATNSNFAFSVFSLVGECALRSTLTPSVKKLRILAHFWHRQSACFAFHVGPTLPRRAPLFFGVDLAQFRLSGTVRRLLRSRSRFRSCCSRLSRFPQISVRPESGRWSTHCFSLAKYCSLSPGDDARVNRVRVIASNVAFENDLQCQVGALALLRRIAGGINASEQQALHRKYASTRGSQKKRLNRQFEYEHWRLLASLEHLLAGTRALLGNELLAKLKKDPEHVMWSLGRLGARIPLYGPLHSVVLPEIAGEWLKRLLDVPLTPVTAAAIILIARRTGNSSRDVDETIRAQAISRLTALGTPEHTIQLLSTYVVPERADAVRSFGESLPPGLQLVSSANCLLSVPAFHDSGSEFSA